MRSSKLRYKQKYVPLIRRQKFSLPVHEDGISLVTIEIGKWSKRKSGNFLVGAADWFTSTTNPGIDSGGGSWHSLPWCSRLMVSCSARLTGTARSSREVTSPQLFSQHSTQNVILNERVLPCPPYACFTVLWCSPCTEQNGMSSIPLQEIVEEQERGNAPEIPGLVTGSQRRVWTLICRFLLLDL